MLNVHFRESQTGYFLSTQKTPIARMNVVINSSNGHQGVVHEEDG